MSAELAHKVFSLVESAVRPQITPVEFEMAYQARVAIDRIRFAIRVTEKSVHHPEQLREAGFQLLDALGRLEAAERSFQRRFRSSSRDETTETTARGVNGAQPITD
jgi:hypothetical protein